MGQQTESQGATPKGAGGGHTAGPWRVEGTRVVSDAGLIVRQDAAYDAAQDDLRLIAAAPDSHEANKLSLMVLCAIRAAGVLSHDQNFLWDLDSAIDANRAALAKAGGES